MYLDNQSVMPGSHRTMSDFTHLTGGTSSKPFGGDKVASIFDANSYLQAKLSNHDKKESVTRTIPSSRFSKKAPDSRDILCIRSDLIGNFVGSSKVSSRMLCIHGVNW
jgi:hypothetical protein